MAGDYQWQRVQELFESTSLKPSDQQLDWLRAQCGEDVTLFAEVQSLLEASRKVEEAALRAATPGNVNAGSIETRRYGPWQAVRVLGVGGMGSVLLVRRADGEFEQTAALKLVAPHLAGPYFLERFRIERQILAHLNHPNITKLLDGGVAEDDARAPYLVMEYVDGLPVDRYADEQKLPVRERIRLFLKICDAVAFAHRNLVIHRDLKPGNILVERATGEPKLLDFGTARLLPSSGDTDITAPMHRLVTPRYASPEALRHAPITTQADVFSLGVLLYELVTGAWPFGELTTPAELVQRITDGSMTPPDARITGSLAEARSSNVRELQRLVRGDLTKVLSKATQPSLDERYKGVEELAADLRAYLDGMPVSAQPPTFVYRSSKFIRRHWLSLSATVLFVFGMAAAATVAIYQAHEAQERYHDLRSLTTSLLSEMKDAIRDVPGSTPAQQIMLTRVMKNLDKMTRMSSDPAVQLDLAEAYAQLGELQGSPYGQNLGDPKGALASVEKGLQILRSPTLSGSTSSMNYLRILGLLERTAGEVSFGTGNTKMALERLARASSAFDRMAVLTSDPNLIAEAASTHGVYGDVLGQPATASASDPVGAAEQYRKGTELDRRILATSPDHVRARRGVSFYLTKQADLLLSQDPHAAYDLSRAAMTELQLLPARELEKPANQRFLLNVERKTGNVLTELRRFAEAEQLLKKVVKAREEILANDPADLRAMYDLAVVMHDLGRVYVESDHAQKGVANYEQLVRIMDELLRRDPTNRIWQANTASMKFHLADFLRKAHPADPAVGRRISVLNREASQQIMQVANAANAAVMDYETAFEILLSNDPQAALYFAGKAFQAGHPKDILHLAALAESNLATGRHVEARRIATEALSYLPAGARHSTLQRARLETVLQRTH
jgi:serine/threonine protein kinase